MSHEIQAGWLRHIHVEYFLISQQLKCLTSILSRVVEDGSRNCMDVCERSPHGYNWHLDLLLEVMSCVCTS